MSWQLASFAIVGARARRSAGWWYERSRPPAKLVALVATLAALAALGRDAFAALPDVKPITAIVLVGGYALRRRSRLRRRRDRRARLEHPARPGPLDALADARLGARRAARRRRLGRAQPAAPRRVRARARLRARRARLQPVIDLYTLDRHRRSHTLPRFGVVLGAGARVRRHRTWSRASLFGLAFGPALLRMLAARARAPGGDAGSRCRRLADAAPARRGRRAGRDALARRRAARSRRRSALALRRRRARVAPRHAPRRRVARARARLPALGAERRRRLRRGARAVAAASCTPPGRRWASPPPGATRASVRRDGHSRARRAARRSRAR